MRFTLWAAILMVPNLAWAYGEPDESGSPNRHERLLHVLTNQVRQAPHDWPGWDTSLATPQARTPLAHQKGLSEAARFHADDMAMNDCFMHESCDGTPFPSRLARYFQGAAGENIYKSFGDDDARSAITGWMNSDGHRVNMLREEWTWLGTGFALQSNWVYYVQNFGSSRGEPAKIPAAAVERMGADVRLIANFHDPDGDAPQSVTAVVDGERIKLELVVGAASNQTAQATIAAPSGCAKVYFEAIDGKGERSIYPSTGALLEGPDCQADFSETTPEQPAGPMGPVIVNADDRELGGCVCVNTPNPSSAWWLALFVFAFWRARRARLD